MYQDPLKSFFEDPLHMDNVVVLRSRTISMSDLEGQRGFMVNPTPECAMFRDEAIMCTHAGLSILTKRSRSNQIGTWWWCCS